jgi:microcystin-dependent protein
MRFKWLIGAAAVAILLQVSPPALAGLIGNGTNTVSAVGGGQPHNNRQPYLALNFCIALQGIFPARS